MTRLINRLPRASLWRATLAIATAAATMATVAVAAPALAAPVTYQAESATISQGVVESNHTGFTGSGFVNYDNVAGGFVEFTVNVATAQTLPLAFRYANGTTANRPMRVDVNGTTVAASLAFPGTGAWTTWQSATVSAALRVGDNVVRATATGASGGPNLDALTVDGDIQPPPRTDWATRVTESTMDVQSPGEFGGWGYTQGLTLWGMYLNHQRRFPGNANSPIIRYARQWADRFVNPDGTFVGGRSFGNLDSMQSGNVLLFLYRETGQVKYRRAAGIIRQRLNSYPRTSDGGWWHAAGASRRNQLWGDGVFMVLPFLMRYGAWVGDADHAGSVSLAQTEGPRQLEIYFRHLRDNNSGLLRHAWAQDPDDPAAGWANPTTGQAPESWCRAMGWFGMATIEVLELIPANHPRRQALIDIVRFLVNGWSRYQDPATGRWFQVVNRGDRADNWTETSCSSMYTYVTSRAVERNYVDASFRAMAQRGYRGVLQKVSLDGAGHTRITDICEGTNVGSYSFYINRRRLTNDKHGLGAFLIMAEQMQRVEG
jgi:unsaturated rhamnogalacturonyl hydrolase